MTNSPELADLNNHHRDTLMKIFQHPTSHNIDWRTVLSLLEVVGTLEESGEGKVRVHVGDGMLFLEKPRHKDIDVQQVLDLRHLLTNAGYKSVVDELESRGVED
ncbi:MAG: hypothetical protein ACYC19_05365 [Acidimicrobiales bacterium]